VKDKFLQKIQTAREASSADSKRTVPHPLDLLLSSIKTSARTTRPKQEIIKRYSRVYNENLGDLG
jgi:methionine synthase II (cobalamin-independent)